MVGGKEVSEEWRAGQSEFVRFVERACEKCGEANRSQLNH